MADPVYAQPDLEKFAWALLKPIGGVTAWIAATVLDYPPWQMRYTYSVDARASTRNLARNKAFQAMYVLLDAPNQPWADGVLTYVQPTTGLFWLPDDDGCPRFSAQYEMRCHPRVAIPMNGRKVA